MAVTYASILKELKTKIYHPVYFFTGDESFYIDLITQYVEKNILDEMEKEFNFSVFYGLDSNVYDIIGACKRFPMMSEFQVIIVKEAQNLKEIEKFESYLDNPVKSTILVFNYKKKPDERKTFFKKLKTKSVYFSSEKIKDYKLADWVFEAGRELKINLNPKMAHKLGEYLGNDLSKIMNELEKLKIRYPENPEITDDIISENIGISKEFNIFELQNALGEKNILVSNRIANFFGANEKSIPIQQVLPNLNSFFSKIFVLHFLKDKSEKSVASALRIHPFLVKDYIKYARNYDTHKLRRIIGYILDADLKSKGVNTTGEGSGEILKELVFKILH
jgi:DNA polymerase-3 subunit delta